MFYRIKRTLRPVLSEGQDPSLETEGMGLKEALEAFAQSIMCGRYTRVEMWVGQGPVPYIIYDDLGVHEN